MTVNIMKTYVFVLQHLRTHVSGAEAVKLIGIYESKAAAEEAVGRLADKPGFRDNPHIVDPFGDDTDGFYIDKYLLNDDNWAEGFGIQ